jgi:superfamily II DNA or RNA helicase
MTKQKKSDTYYIKHNIALNNIIRTYKDSINSPGLFGTSTYSIFNTIESGITKFPLRYYQMEALFLLDYLYATSKSYLELHKNLPGHKKNPLIDDLLDEIAEKHHAPFLGYEMATGSGKTMLMGASIYFMCKKYQINNFLIITPASTDIYQKTIRNFDIGNFESVWADDTPFTFNVITGDNYTQNLFYNSSKEANIFIFNISKFGTNATNTAKTWESAVWKDENGNSISIKQYLKDKKLIIITDEAHHAQTPVASKIIKNFHPLSVLEFTATAVETEKSEAKKNQTIVYKYDIKRFLEDGYGKLVRAVALANSSRHKKDSISDNEKLKIITLFLIHLMKKEAVLLDPKCRSLKPLSFVKVKDDTIFTKKVYDYIKTELSSDVENINIILEKVSQQDFEITLLLSDLFKNKFNSDISKLQQEIQKVADTSIFYHGRSDKETEKKFLNIRKNEVEIVVYMQRLDEGIDLPNIFSMAVINDNESDFKTSVKQIIGRGVRLNKDKREFDDEVDYLKANSEKLHVICDQGKNFEEVITSIQKEFGLNNKYLSFDKKRSPIINNSKSELLDGKYIPHIRADFKAKENVNLIELISDVETITSKYIEDNCFEGESDEIKRYIKYRPDSFFLEVDVFSDKHTYHKQIKDSKGIPTKMILGEKELNGIYGVIIKTLYCIQDKISTKMLFQKYLDRLNQIGLEYYRIDDSDDKLASNLFISSFSFFYRNHVEKNFYSLDFKQLNELENWNLKSHFKSHELKIPEDQILNNKRTKEKDKQKLIELIEAQYHFYGFEKSVYDYVKFDSFPEFQFSSYIDDVLKDKPPFFWVRNQRNIHFDYGSKKYYPDFFAFKDDILYVVECKGEKFSDTKKNALLEKLNSIEGIGTVKGYNGVLVFSSQLDKMGNDYLPFDKFIIESEMALVKHQSKANLIPDPNSTEKFIKYIPVYSPNNAYKKFVKDQKTPKPDGWLEVNVISEKYPESSFAIQVKGDALAPDFSHNDYIILNYSPNVSESLGKISLVHSELINDEYEGNFTLRKIEISEITIPNSLFPIKQVLLKGTNSDFNDIVLSEINIEQTISVIGIIFNS